MRRTNRTACMSVQDSVRAGICERLLEGVLKEQGAAGRLRLSVRQVRRLKRRVRDEGPGGVIHRSRGQPSRRLTPETVRHEVKRLYRETYAGWNMVHFSEYLASRHQIVLSPETLRQLLLDEESRPRHRCRSRHRQWRERRRREGELVQMDTSIHAWLGEDGEAVVLISAVDDATSRLLWAEFFEHNGVLENLTVVRDLVAKYGLPASLYTDQHTMFFLCEEDALAARERGEDGLTQFGQVMKRLGIEMIPAGSPQAKGRVERSYRTLQDRLLKELRLEGIRTRRAANHYLRTHFIPKYNRQFGVEPADPETAWIDAGSIDEHELFCLRDTRVVQNDATLSVNGQTWQLEGRVRSGQKVELRTWLDGTVHVLKGDREIAYHPVRKARSAAATC